MSIIKDGDNVIIRKDTFLRSESVCCGRRASVQKLHFFLDKAIGYPYGTTFNVKDLHLYIKPPCDPNVSQPKLNTTSGENNLLINDDGNSQNMSRDNIMDLKAAGVTGEKIVGLLVENSDSFEKKTEFSQEKYLKKKKKKHMSEITILKPTVPLICEMLYANSPGKILDLRMDTVSQILTMANIRSNTNVLLMESTQSFLAGVILHRMGGLGNLVQIFSGDFPVRLCLGCFDLEKKDMAILNGFSMTKINAITKLGLVSEDNSKPSTEITGQSDNASTVSSCEQIELNEDDKEESIQSPTDDKKPQKKYMKVQKTLSYKEKVIRKKKRAEEERKALPLLKKRSMDSLIIATKYRAKTALLKLIELLAPSRPLVVYSPYKEILVECYIALKELQNVVLLNLTETWWRTYQVLPSRTHPQIKMSGSGGYLLTGIKVDNGSPDSDDIVEPYHVPVKKMKMDESADDEQHPNEAE